MEENIWVKILILLLITAIIVLCGFNAATYNKIANEKLTVGDVTPGGARALMWFNIIILLFTCPLWIWYVYKLFRNEAERQQDIGALKQYSYDKAMAAGTYVKRGASYATTPSRWSNQTTFFSSPERSGPVLNNPQEIELPIRNSNAQGNLIMKICNENPMDPRCNVGNPFYS